MNLAQAIQNKIGLKTKPTGSLGELERIAFQIACVQGTTHPQIKLPTLLVFAGDHGIATTNLVSPFPQEVTHQMVMNFLQGGAAINVFSQQNSINLKIIDSGVNYDFDPHPSLISAKISKGTRNYLEEPAMTQQQLDQSLAWGRQHILNLLHDDVNTVGFGEMGISNTSSAALIMSAITQIPLEKCVGRGTGANDEQLLIKRKTLKEAQAKYTLDLDALEALRHFGGFEIAQMCGAMLEAFEQNMILVVDGFISTAAFMVAYSLHPEIIKNTLFSHQSNEEGHAKMLQYLNAKPLLTLDLRLGEGTAVALAMPLIQSSILFLNQMASFDSAQVSNIDHHDS
jgi:nicotinate-nucleotide--dimethylbenzimidazole phosphoribosyltransferase